MGVDRCMLCAAGQSPFAAERPLILCLVPPVHPPRAWWSVKWMGKPWTEMRLPVGALSSIQLVPTSSGILSLVGSI